MEEGRAVGSAIEIEPEQGKKCLWGAGRGKKGLGATEDQGRGITACVDALRGSVMAGTGG